MRLIFIRHGLAEGHFSFDQDADFERELTKKGIQRLKSTFKIFTKSVPTIDVIFSSPLVRAIQSAQLLWQFYPQSDLELMADLDILDNPLHLVEYISFLPADGQYAFVGHDPHLEHVIACLLALHPEHDFITLKKGGICVLEGSIWEGLRMELLVSPAFLKQISP
jgi:phosphohistidine phosphatase